MSTPKALSIMLIVLSVLFVRPIMAQDSSTQVVIGERVQLESLILEESREILIHTPPSYGESQERYPVLYLLDGDTNFHHTTGLTTFLASNQLIPELIVIAIPNTDRTRDLTPPSQNGIEISEFPSHGGADKFLGFLSSELIPWVDQNYRTGPYKILVGHSFGGLFTIKSLLDIPELFNAYIAISPSLQWNDQELIPLIEVFSGKTEELQLDLFIAKGNESNTLLPGFQRIREILSSNSLEGFRWRIEELSEESHGSVTHRATYRGLEFIFQEWVVSDYMSIFDRLGMEEFEIFYRTSVTRYGFEERSISSGMLSAIFGKLGSSGRLDEATEVLSYYSEKFQPQAFMYGILAGGFAESGRSVEALEHYRMALQIEPENEFFKTAIIELEEK